MGTIEEIHADLDVDISEEAFRESVEEKIEQMGGLADEETAAMLVAHELDHGGVETVSDIEAGMEEVRFLGKVLSIGDLRTFDRDDGEGRVVNVEAADETGTVRLAFWDEQAEAAAEELGVGQILRIKGRPREGYRGLEVSVDEVEPDDDAEIDVRIEDTRTIESLSIGQSDVTVTGVVLDTESVRTFDRDDGSEGRVANLVLGDETGRVRVTLWDDRADRAAELAPGTTVEVVDGYVREREGDLELHVGDRGAIEAVDADVEYTPDTADIGTIEIGETVDIAGVVRSADPKRTFDRDDGSEGQVRNIRVQDGTGDIRAALWGEKADTDLGPGDEVLLADVEITDGWQDELEASANWRSTVMVLDEGTGQTGTATPETDADAGPDDRETADSEGPGLSAFADDDEGGDGASAPDGSASEQSSKAVEFTGTVVQTGDPVVLDDGEETVTVRTDADVRLGQEVTARGHRRDDRLDAEEVF